MFLYGFDMMEKMAFVQLAREMATVDDAKVDENERTLLYVMANEMQVPMDNFLSIEFNLEQLAEKFKTDTSKRVCLSELYSIAMANRELHEKQKIMLDALVVHFGIEAEEVQAIKDWVSKAMALNKEGMELMLMGENR